MSANVDRQMLDQSSGQTSDQTSDQTPGTVTGLTVQGTALTGGLLADIAEADKRADLKSSSSSGPKRKYSEAELDDAVHEERESQSNIAHLLDVVSYDKSSDYHTAEENQPKMSKAKKKREARKMRKLNNGSGHINDNELAYELEQRRTNHTRESTNAAGGTASSINNVSPTTTINDDPDVPWELVTRRKGSKNKKVPKKDSNSYPTITYGKTARLQSRIQVSDLRNLVTYIFADGTAPQWVAVNHRPSFRKIVAIVVPGLEEFMFQPGCNFADKENSGSDDISAMKKRTAEVPQNSDATPRQLVKDNLPFAVQPLADVFGQLWPCRARGNDKHGILHSPIATFLSVPLPKSADDKEHKSIRNMGDRPRAVRTRITEFLATLQEYYSNNFRPHPAQARTEQERKDIENNKPEGWVYTKVTSLDEGTVPEDKIPQGSLTAGRTIYSVDCEMVKIGHGRDDLALARVSILSWDGETVMDELVKPYEEIVDYVTEYSGIKKSMLENVTTRIEDIQTRLLKLVDAKTILVGHSLDSDMKALKMAHPFIVDTSICFPHAVGPPLKNKLRYLAKKYLNEIIQAGEASKEGHDSREDARACLDLMKKKCENGKHWGATPAGGPGGEGAAESLFHRLERAGTSYRNQGGPAATGGVATGKTTAAVDWGEIRKTIARDSPLALGGCENDAQVEKQILRAVRGDPDGKEIPGGGVDFVYARMRTLEALRGFWNARRSGPLLPTQDGRGPPSKEDIIKMLDAEEMELKAGEEQSTEAYGGEGEPEKSILERCVRSVALRIQRIHEQLPPCTALIVFSGTGDPRAMGMLLDQRARHKNEFNKGVPYDQIGYRWTDEEEQLLKQAVRKAREGVAFITVK